MELSDFWISDVMRKTRFYDLRTDNDYKQSEIAILLDVKEDTYSKWERGINDFPLEKANQLSKIYNVSLDYLLGLSDNKNSKIAQNEINLKRLCQNLKKLRKQRHISQDCLSSKLGFPQTTYSNYERGLGVITTQKLIIISQFYQVSFDYLIGKSKNV